MERLESICRETPHCLAFNTNGLLKHTLRRPLKWTRWTEDANKGLYVLGKCFLGMPSVLPCFCVCRC